MNYIIFTIIGILYLGFSKSCDKDMLLWVSLDGLSNDFFTAENAPFLYSLSRKGMYSPDGLGTVYVTATFPNHFTIVTGLHAETHGIVSNRFKEGGKTFGKRSVGEKWYNPNGTTIPIWIANELKNNGQKTSVLHWVGSVSSYNGRYPSFYIDPYRSEEPWDVLKMVYENISSCEFNLIMAYIYKIDSVGHNDGLRGGKYVNTIKSVDLDFETFYNRLVNNNLHKKLSIVVTSDHGMQDMDPKKLYYISNYTNETYEAIYTGVAVLLTTHGDLVAAKNIVRDLNEVEEKKWTAYLKEEIPEEYHYRYSNRIPEVVVFIDDNYCLYADPEQSSDSCGIKGQHGYDYQHSEPMKAMFFAYGPMFPSLAPQQNIKNVDLYPLICKVLNVEEHCNPHNGSYAAFYFPSSGLSTFAYVLISLAVILVLAIIIGTVCYFVFARKKRVVKKPLDKDVF